MGMCNLIELRSEKQKPNQTSPRNFNFEATPARMKSTKEKIRNMLSTKTKEKQTTLRRTVGDIITRQSLLLL